MALGVAALVLEDEPSLPSADLEARLKETGVPVLDAANGVTTCRVDAYEAAINDGGPVCATAALPPPANDDFANAITDSGAASVHQHAVDGAGDTGARGADGARPMRSHGRDGVVSVHPFAQ